MSKKHNDWYRACHNLPPRPLDWQDKVAIYGSCATSAVLLLILAFGG